MTDAPAMNNPLIKSTLTYRPLNADDVRAAHALSTSIRWPHRLEDWQFIADTGTGFVAEDGGELAGTALAWKFGADRASIGMVIVAPNQQGRGIGRKLMELLLDALKERAVFLHATSAGRPLYEKLGFQACGWLDQHQGVVETPPAVALANGERLRPVNLADLPKLVELASAASGFDRSALLPPLLGIADGVVLEREGEILGFSMFRPFGLTHVIGPVVATDDAGHARAKALIAHWLTLHKGRPVRIDVPGVADLSDWLASLGMLRVDKVIRMVWNASASPVRSGHASQYRAFGIISQAMA